MCLSPEDVRRLREMTEQDMQNCLIRDMLQSGRSVRTQFTGSAFRPDVRSGDMTMWGPVHDYSKLKEGGVVFCAVQPRNKVCAAMIYKVGICDSPDGGKEGYQMVCNPTTESMAYSGWCTDQHIFGQLVYACYDRLHQPVCHTLAF